MNTKLVKDGCELSPSQLKAKDICNITLNNKNKIVGLFPIKSEYHSFTIDDKPQNLTHLVLVLKPDYSVERYNIRGFENFIVLHSVDSKRHKPFILSQKIESIYITVSFIDWIQKMVKSFRL
jgi:hypothetical protein